MKFWELVGLMVALAVGCGGDMIQSSSGASESDALADGGDTNAPVTDAGVVDSGPWVSCDRPL